MTAQKILVAMSGGVDSAVAAALLVEQGHDVTGVHLKLADVPLHEQLPGHGCCTLDDAQDARRVSQNLGIPFYVWDLGEVFRREVQDPFAEQYADGVTPNPCVSCNEKVKYRALLARARSLGFDALATGHHVRIATGPDGPALHRSADPTKDQSYVLYMATADELDHTRFPLGSFTKDQVREMAEERNLRVAGKPDSYDVCFIPDGDTAGYLSKHLPVIGGDIVDLEGRVLGQHNGVWHYTIGQRRGLGLSQHERLFVLDVDATKNRVVVGPREALACDWIEIDDASWISGVVPTGKVEVQIRAHGRPHTGTVTVTDQGGVRLTVDEPYHGVALGQSAVVYVGDRCLGGGRIARAARPALAR